jgi:hypothetical protein
MLLLLLLFVVDVVRVLVVVSAWALAHHAKPHRGELTDLGRQRAAEAVNVQILGWYIGEERGPNMSQYNGAS